MSKSFFSGPSVRPDFLTASAAFSSSFIAAFASGELRTTEKSRSASV